MQDLASYNALHLVYHNPAISKSRCCTAWPTVHNNRWGPLLVAAVPVPYTLIDTKMTPESLREPASNDVSHMTARGMCEVM